MNTTLKIYGYFSGFLERFLKICMYLAMIAIALMVLAILYQIIMRYVFNSAPAWSEEAARFFMLWMVAFLGPVAFRQGGFIAIEMLAHHLPERISKLLMLMLLCISGIVIFFLVKSAYAHVNSGWLFSSASLKLPLDLIGLKSIKLKLAYVYMPLLVCFAMMFIINLELIFRKLIEFARPDITLPKMLVVANEPEKETE
ncbi:MAG: TRAP transporter small permease [Alphaproteobacteria bacterium]